MILSNLLSQLPGIRRVQGNPHVEILGLTHDSRKVRPGYLFIAIKGFQTDGHQFIGSAHKAGAVAVVCDTSVDIDLPGLTCIYCENSRKLIADISAKFYGYPSKKMLLVGVTGTNGKTTTNYYLQHLLTSNGKKTGRIGTTGIEFQDQTDKTLHTTPESSELQAILANMYHAGSQAVVMEVSSHALHLHRVRALQFDAAIFTNLTQDHLDYHKTFDHYLRAKNLLFQNLSDKAFAVINIDDAYAGRVIQDSPARIVTISLETDADYRIHTFRNQADMIHLTLNTPQGQFKARTNVIGKFNYYNLLSAFAVVLELGFNVRTTIEALKHLPVVPGRMERIQTNFPVHIFIDYAHTPDAISTILQALSESYPESRIICVFGCGGERDKTKRPMMGRIATELSDLTIITEDNPRNESSDKIIEDILKGCDTSSTFKVVKNRTDAIISALNEAQYGDIVAILGKGHEDYQDIGGKRIPYSDFDVVVNYLEQHGYTS